MTTSARVHTDCTYGAIAVGKPRPEDADRPQQQRRYDITWLCCDTQTLMEQKELTVRRRNWPGLCIRCRNEGKTPVWTPEGPPSEKPKVGGHIDIKGVGLFVPLFGWAGKVARPWAD